MKFSTSRLKKDLVQNPYILCEEETFQYKYFSMVTIPSCNKAACIFLQTFAQATVNCRNLMEGKCTDLSSSSPSKPILLHWAHNNNYFQFHKKLPCLVFERPDCRGKHRSPVVDNTCQPNKRYSICHPRN